MRYVRVQAFVLGMACTLLPGLAAFAAEKTAQDLVHSRQLIKGSDNRRFFDYQMGNTEESPSELGEQLPAGFSREALASALLGKPTARIPKDVRVGVVPYPAQSDAHIAWAYLPSNWLADNRRSPPRLFLGLLEGQTKERLDPAQWIVEPIREMDLGLDEEPFAFDFGRFPLGRLGRAFGLRTITHGCGAGGSICSATNLLLFVPFAGRLAKVLDAQVAYFGNLGGDWNEDGTRQHIVVEENAVLVIKGGKSPAAAPPLIELRLVGQRKKQRWTWRAPERPSDAEGTAAPASPGWYVTDDPEILSTVSDESTNRPASRFVPAHTFADPEEKVLPRKTAEGLLLRTPAQRLEAVVTKKGLGLRVPGAKTNALVMQVAGLRRGTTPVEIGPPTLVFDEAGGTVKLERPSLAQEIWASAAGLVQKFLLEKRPEGQGALSLSLAVSGGSEIRRWLASQRVEARALYNLTVDASVVSTAEGITLVIRDEAAHYPLRVLLTVADGPWQGLGVVPGVRGEIKTAVVGTQGEIYVGGSFEHAGEVRAANVAVFDGRAWSALGRGVSAVQALALDRRGALYAATRDRVQVWDGHAWSALGDEHNNLVAVVVDDNDRVYRATQNWVWMWNGSAWVGLEKGWDAPHVRALAVDSGGRLYAAVEPRKMGNSNVIVWDGTEWSGVGGGTDKLVTSLAVDRAGRLFAGGTFEHAGGQQARGVAMWANGAWRSYDIGADGWVSRLLVDPKGALYAWGHLKAFNRDSNTLARWNGSSWSRVPDSSEPLAVDGAGVLYATSLGPGFMMLRRWDGHAWSLQGGSLGSSVYGPPSLVAVSGTGDLFMATPFSSWRASTVARWKNDAGLDLHCPLHEVHALAADNAGNLFAAGRWATKPGVWPQPFGVLRWNGKAWSTLAEEHDPGSVLALAVDDAGNLYAGGEMKEIAGVETMGVARWNGNSWSALGSGISGKKDENGRVSALAVDAAGKLYAAGEFEKAGGSPARNVARWDGKAWSSLGDGAAFPVSTFAVNGKGEVYAGDSASRVSAWDGRAWSTLAPGPTILALATDPAGDLYAAGATVTVEGRLVSGGIPSEADQRVGLVAKWTEGGWAPLGLFDAEVNALVVDGSATIFAAGPFKTQDGRPVGHVARLPALIEDLKTQGGRTD